MFAPARHRVVIAWPCRGKRSTRFIRRGRSPEPGLSIAPVPGAEMKMASLGTLPEVETFDDRLAASLGGKDVSTPQPPSPIGPAMVHPVIVRVTHWVNAVAIIVMIMSGLQIHNAYPVVPFRFPGWITLGDWLGGALLWHFSAMWALTVNFVVLLAYGLASGRLRERFLPIRPAALLADVRSALTGRLKHDRLVKYNAVQKLLYSGVLALISLVILSGFALWKPVQFQTLTALMGGFEGARIVHFACMAAIFGFLVLHVAMAVLVPKSLRAMFRGH